MALTKALFPTTFDEKTKIWSGAPKRVLYDPDASMGEVVFNALRNYPENVSQISDIDGRVITFQDIREWATRIAIYFKSEKLTHEDVVGIIGNASTYVTSLAVACLFNTTPFHAVAYTYMKEPDVILGLYEVTKPKIMFCDGHDYEVMKEVTKGWAPKIITLTGRVEGVTSIEDLLKPHPYERIYKPELLVEGGEQTAVILCSSGTSGNPKAVALSHQHVAKVAPITNATDIILTSATLDWMTGFSCTMLSFLFGSRQVIFNEVFNAESFIRMTAQYKVTMYAMAPWQAYEVFTHPSASEEKFASLRTCCIVGGWLSTAILQKAQDMMKNGRIMFSYGTTEAAGISISLDLSLENSVGGLLPGVRVKIVDEEGNALGHNQTGEILIDMGVKWKGYVGNPEDTAATLKGDWINLGDVGHFDDNNFLYLTDRKKDVLKYKSKDYWPNEIEQYITELPGVQTACVVGVRNVGRSDAAGALVILKPGTQLTKQEIIDHVAKRVVVEYKHLNAGVQFVDQLPLNANGKVMRNQARQLFEKLSEGQ